jgi:putative restriction endonuclease
MAGFRFSTLADLFIAELEKAGAVVLVASGVRSRPLVLSVNVDDTAYQLEVYLWTITGGGKGRNRPREFRVQLTDKDRKPPKFVLKAGVRTIVGGWHEDSGVFAFWDVRRHLFVHGKSSSCHISLDTLEEASTIGMATAVRNVAEGEEISIAVQPDYLLWYIREYERLYDCGPEVEQAAELVEASPEDVREFIDGALSDDAAGRRYKVTSVVRAFREARFRPAVLRAYGWRCSLTGVALRLVDAAHIIPVSDPRSTDETRNGIALNPLLHRAYDFGLLGLLPGGRTAINQRLLSALQKQRLGDGVDLVRRMIPLEMRMPGSPDQRPPDEYLHRGLLARGWKPEEIQRAIA